MLARTHSIEKTIAVVRLYHTLKHLPSFTKPVLHPLDS